MLRKKLKNKKGMTLIELMVGMLIFSMLGASASVILAPTMRVAFGAIDLAENNSLLALMSSELLSDMKRAVNMTVTVDNELEIEIGAFDSNPILDGAGNPILDGAGNPIIPGEGSRTIVYGLANPDDVEDLRDPGETGILRIRTGSGEHVWFVHQPEYYNWKTIGLEFLAPADPTETPINGAPLDGEVIVRIRLFGADGNEITFRDYAVRPLGMNTFN